MHYFNSYLRNDDFLLDCSRQEEINHWAKKLKVSPQAIKTAIRACCSNHIATIAYYIQSTYLPAKKNYGPR